MIFLPSYVCATIVALQEGGGAEILNYIFTKYLLFFGGGEISSAVFSISARSHAYFFVGSVTGFKGTLYFFVRSVMLLKGILFSLVYINNNNKTNKKNSTCNFISILLIIDICIFHTIYNFNKFFLYTFNKNSCTKMYLLR